jgi:hypothetical protein
MLASTKLISSVDPYYWGDLRSQAQRFSGALDLRRWLSWESDVQELLQWDRERLAHREPPFALRVVWTKTDARAYKLVFSPLGSFNSVSYGTKSIYLREQISDGTLVHEIGHVLGFDDHYETYWDDKHCLVQGRVYLRDVMANSSFKRPLPGHWRLLDKAYPWAKATPREPTFSYRQEDVFWKGVETQASAR